MASRKKEKTIATAPASNTEPVKGQNSPTNGAVTPTADVSIPANFPIVGIGASAGGLAAFESFFFGNAG